jgi:hypothetical protein
MQGWLKPRHPSPEASTYLPVKLQQGQVWKTADGLLRIVRLERLEVGFKTLSATDGSVGVHRTATKKEFCRMLKGATQVEAVPASKV